MQSERSTTELHPLTCKCTEKQPLRDNCLITTWEERFLPSDFCFPLGEERSIRIRLQNIINKKSVKIKNTVLLLPVGGAGDRTHQWRLTRLPACPMASGPP
ncbi:hypothetical protein AVEN_183031-1 [Araneus ventricosus]|uniref:Uncharacterized protein n=1 Tax=Araneus ventricosus TaxID=182803 RepID=A0A4Y2RF67_ARAVE|nr:hypothetical protein AVEN_183031-1 [Araneus ventricosus]